MFNQLSHQLDAPSEARVDEIQSRYATGDESECFQYGEQIICVIRNTRFGYFGADLFYPGDTEPGHTFFVQHPEHEEIHEGWEDCELMELANYCAEWLY